MSDKDAASRRQKMLAVNEAQTEYYEATSAGWISPVNSWATNLWNRLRHRAMVAVSAEARDEVYATHRAWMGDLAGKKVLDLGAGSGSPLSGYLAQNAGTYHAIDLSEMQLETLRSHIGDGPDRQFIKGDFLDPATTEGGYDLIYAHAVLHHFQYMEVVLDQMAAKPAPKGRVITYDPSQTWPPIYVLRALYRPFQVDAAWEHPFSRKSFRQIEARFAVRNRLGVFRRGKWALILGVLSPRLGQRFGDALFLHDFRQGPQARLGGSLHVSYHLSL